jgi:hypothetical protein
MVDTPVYPNGMVSGVARDLLERTETDWTHIDTVRAFAGGVLLELPADLAAPESLVRRLNHRLHGRFPQRIGQLTPAATLRVNSLTRRVLLFVLSEEFVRAGDLGNTGFVPWEVEPIAALDRIESRLLEIGGLSEVWTSRDVAWFEITDAGRAFLDAEGRTGTPLNP